ncbi:hypothetical protein HDU96_011053 [Phlyctochytrium bullatum]|nr:hypothetical protein HDU96_011053 [Phlyctochytrium bullatum]
MLKLNVDKVLNNVGGASTASCMATTSNPRLRSISTPLPLTTSSSISASSFQPPASSSQPPASSSPSSSTTSSTTDMTPSPSTPSHPLFYDQFQSLAKNMRAAWHATTPLIFSLPTVLRPLSLPVSDATKRILSAVPTPALGAWARVTPFRQLLFLYKLFFSKTHLVHRLGGLAYLIQWAIAFRLYFWYYEDFINSYVVWTLPLTGVFQSVNAAFAFRFLSRTKKDGGYFGDKSVLSHPFVVENSFFALCLFFQWVYFNNRFAGLISSTVISEQTFVFFPYLIRQLWPKTSFRDSMANAKNRTDKNDLFVTFTILVTKVFYIFCKHIIGFYLNYVRFLDRITPADVRNVYHVSLFSAFATTIAVFVQTLKFKRYIGPRTSAIIVVLSYALTMQGFFKLGDVVSSHPDLMAISMIGLVLNFGPFPVHVGWQVAMALLLNASRAGVDLGTIGGVKFLHVGNQNAFATAA